MVLNVSLSRYFTAELSTIVCKGDQVPMLLEHAHSCKGLKNMVKMGSQVTEEENTTAKGLGIRLISFEDLEVNSVFVVKDLKDVKSF